MHYIAYKKGSGRSIETGRGHICHGCGRKSPPKKTEIPPPRWEIREDRYYNKVGVGNGRVMNAYCPSCVSAGCTARTVAATTKKFRDSMKALRKAYDLARLKLGGIKAQLES